MGEVDTGATERGTPEQLLRQQTALARFGELALTSDDLDEILTEACRLVSEALGTELAKVMELQADGETLLVRAGVGWKPGVVGVIVIKVTDNTSEGLALKTGEPMISPNIATETRFVYPHFLIDNGVQAVCNVVILGGHGRAPYGILQIDSRQPRHFTGDDTSFLSSYANVLAAAVDRMRVMALVRAGEERLRFATLAGRLGVWELVLDTREFTASEMCKDNFGRDPNAPFTYLQLLDAVHPDDRKRSKAALDYSIATGTEYAIEHRILRPDGATGWVQMHAQVVPAMDGRRGRLAGISLDITERVRAEERVRQSQRVEAVGRLTAGLAHDFNNVLQALQGNLELAIGEIAGQPDVRADLELALQSVQHGARLTSHLLSFSRQQMLRPSSLKLSPLLEKLSRTLARMIGNDIVIHLDLAADLPDIFADSAHLESALLNLALNSRHAMPKGGELRLRTRVRKGQVVLAVIDTGLGMTPQVLAQACDPFFSTKGGDGSGLGLSMVQGFARQSGGELRIQSTPEWGTCVEICLPLAQSPAIAMPPADGAEVRGHGTVLVVDDDESVRRVTVAFLKKAGFDVHTAGDGNEAVAVLSTGVLFHALVTDYAMVGMSGGDLVLQARELYPTLPAMVITGYVGAEGLDNLPAGVTILRKPFHREELVRLVKVLIDGSKRVSLSG